MNWKKVYLQSETGRSIGKDKDEAVFIDITSGLMAVKDGSEPYIAHIMSMSQFKVYLEDKASFDEIFKVQGSEVKEVKEEKTDKVKKK
jgi:hypothetical protein